MRIFWAWQSDREAKACRNFIKSALERAIAQLASEAEVEDSERPELDHDTKGTPGMPDIVATIFDKISKASIFVADVTTVGRTRRRKALQNPNVLIELGYAKRALGVDRILLIANGYWYKGPADLPFDLRHRRGPIVFTLAPDATDDVRRTVKKQLVSNLVSALKETLTALHISTPVKRIAPRDRNRSVWFDKGARLQHRGYHGTGNPIFATAIEGPRAYMRVMAGGWKKEPPSRAVLRDLDMNAVVWPIFGTTSGDGGQNADGLLLYGFTDRPDGERIIHSAAQLFREKAELWTFNSAILSGGNPLDYLAVGPALYFWQTTLRKGVTMLKQLSAKGPFEVEAGIVGLEKMHWPEGDRARAVDNEAFISRTDSAWNEDKQEQFMRDLEIAVADAFGVSLPVRA